MRTLFLGFPGGNISCLLVDEHHRIRREILQHPADIVVLQMSGNDLAYEDFNLYVYISNVWQTIH